MHLALRKREVLSAASLQPHSFVGTFSSLCYIYDLFEMNCIQNFSLL